MSAVYVLSEALDKVPVDTFPWREEDRPFLILLSEMMLIRTRADLVVNVYVNFVKRFPTPEQLAQGDDEEVASLLTPLGLSKRIPLFKKAAIYISEKHSDRLPRDRKALEKIPGVGPYTADALLAFAFDMSVTPADVNIFRWISRVTCLPMKHSSKGSKTIRQLLPCLEPLSGRKAYKLIDFTRNVCRSRVPQCKGCPIIDSCCYGLSWRNMSS